ncbi:glycogen/starch/alpha-glucan phosphorylase [Maribrevibacterium harenarium]|uniref:glycogen/starch/alpha-glucan phosphorylase n=1 Tax=Maribrevibacterium harenarium TaxID=2589817 RepID=UPI001F188B72|nr:glycogen/starch/alpha-glucan phosphorylase [Maribrevibacterium harenarium]
MSKTNKSSFKSKALKVNHSSCDSISDDLKRHFELTLGRDEVDASHYYLYNALALTLRDHQIRGWRETRNRYRDMDQKRVAYLSLEFLMGRAINNAILNLDLDAETRAALQDYAVSLESLVDEEMDAGLGNGGLGRLAACFLDSCASLALPVTGYGIRYEYGMFHQRIEEGYQVEAPDNWLRKGNPWEIESPENTFRVKFYGRTNYYTDETGQMRASWLDTSDVMAVPYDMPVPGYRNDTVNTLRLWKSEATDEFNLDEFNAGSYVDAVAAKNLAEQITMVLYPNDSSENGKQLRLRQQYFLSSASLQDILQHWVRHKGEKFTSFAEKNVFQLNDTHPTIAVAELMRLLMDDHGLQWDEAWSITTNTMAYTNHTLLPEALETWSVRMFASMLPRLLDIIYEINARFLAEVSSRYPDDNERLRRMSIIDEEGEPRIRMAYLAIIGSFSVNGVAALHTDLLKVGLFADFYEFWPEKFNNKTNGVTPRRWLHHSNPGLRDLISSKIGEEWVTNLDQLALLKPFATDKEFQKQWHNVKLDNKRRLAELVKATTSVSFDTTMLFDVQVKRIHEYKRQLLNVLHVIHLYDRICRGDTSGMVPRAVLIGGKAAPGYAMAKTIIKLVNSVAEVVNSNPKCEKWLKVAFIPDYKVSFMEVIAPAADLSEQISTAGKEASGTGNMKFMMNGACTIGTLDGANIEIREAVGAENFFLFGLDSTQVEEARLSYDPNALIDADSDFKRVMNLIESGHFNQSEPGIFDSVSASIRSRYDAWMTAADFRGFVNTQKSVAETYKARERWLEMSILNTSCSGRFSSDRTIRNYNDEIWKVQ